MCARPPVIRRNPSNLPRLNGFLDRDLRQFWGDRAKKVLTAGVRVPMMMALNLIVPGAAMKNTSHNDKTPARLVERPQIQQLGHPLGGGLGVVALMEPPTT